MKKKNKINAKDVLSPYAYNKYMLPYEKAAVEEKKQLKLKKRKDRIEVIKKFGYDVLLIVIGALIGMLISKLTA